MVFPLLLAFDLMNLEPGPSRMTLTISISLSSVSRREIPAGGDFRIERTSLYILRTAVEERD